MTRDLQIVVKHWLRNHSKATGSETRAVLTVKLNWMQNHEFKRVITTHLTTDLTMGYDIDPKMFIYNCYSQVISPGVWTPIWAMLITFERDKHFVCQNGSQSKSLIYNSVYQPCMLLYNSVCQPCMIFVNISGYSGVLLIICGGRHFNPIWVPCHKNGFHK